MGSDHGRQEIFKNVGVRSRRTQGGHEGLQAGVECGCRRARTPLNRRGELVSNESGGVGRIGRPTIEVLGAEDEMAKRRVRKFPNRKISETFLHFAAPLLHDLPGEAPERRARNALQVSFTAWNAVIFADVLNDDRYLTEIRHLTADKPETALLVEQMVARKRALFADDARLIGNWEVTRTEEGINLHADARDPHSLPRNRTDQH